MAHLIVGTNECKIIHVVEILANDEEFYKKWADVARSLEISWPTIAKTEQQLLLGMCTHYVAYHDCLSDWRCSKVNDATLGVLISVLNNFHLNNVADKLREKFNIPLEDTEKQGSSGTTMNTENLLIGPNEVETIQQYLGDDKDFHGKWEDVFRNLNVSRDYLAEKKIQSLNPETCIENIYHDCLENWRSTGNTNATVEKLVSALYRFQLNDIADELMEEFDLSLEDLEKQEEPLSPSTTWSELSKERKEVLLQRNVTFQKRVTNIETIFKELKFTKKARNNFLDKHLDHDFLADLHYDRNPIIFRDTLPDKIQYYIERTFTSRIIISANVFKNKSDIFLVSGIVKHMLSRLAESEITDTASQQAEQRNLTVRYILLEYNSDFDDISEKTSKPVHWLQHKDGAYNWRRSRGNMEAIQRNTTPEQKEIRENKFLQQLETRSKAPICISDSPGMGKSMLLANQGKMIQTEHPERLVLFVVLRKFISQVKNVQENPKSMIHVLLESFCRTSFEINLGRLYFELKDLKIDMLFDGLDEVSSEDFEVALNTIMWFNSLPAVRVWVTTRPHHRDSLENSLQQLSYNIQAFDRGNQITFLVRYWAHISKTQGVVLDKPKLEEFAKACLAALKNRTKDVDRWAGVPLQCMLIAEVFRKKAVKFSNPSNKRNSNTSSISISTLKQLFDRLVEKKFELFKERYPEFRHLTQEELEMSHIIYSIQVVLPEVSIEELQIGAPLPVETLLKVGLMEASSTGQAPQFLHLTFAEYFVAKFVHYGIQSGLGIFNESNGLLDIIFKTRYQNSVFQRHQVFKFPVVIYFFNLFLDQNPLALPLSQCFELNKIAQLMEAAICSNHLSLLRWFLEKPSVPHKIISEHLFLAVAFGDINVIEEVIKLFEKEQILGLTRLRIGRELSLLHVAAERGNYKIFEFLVKNHGFSYRIKNTPNGFLHRCVRDTKDEEGDVIHDRVQIISAIVKLKPLNLEEGECDVYDKETPLICRHVHVELLQAMIFNGANALAQLQDGETVLHMAARYLSRDKYDQLLRSIPVPTFKKLVRIVDRDKNSAMHAMIAGLEPLESSVKYFIEHGHDVNSKHNFRGYNCVGQAVRSNRSVEFVETLLSLGESGESIDGKGSSLLFVAVKSNHVKILGRFSQEYDINSKNEDGDTPLHWAFYKDSSADAFTLELLLSLGVNVNSKNHQGNTPLHVAAACYYEQPKLIDCLQRTMKVRCALGVKFPIKKGLGENLVSMKKNVENIYDCVTIRLEEEEPSLEYKCQCDDNDGDSGEKGYKVVNCG